MQMMAYQRQILDQHKGQTVDELSPEAMEFVRLFRVVDQEAQELVLREICLMTLFGDPFSQEVKGLGLVSETDRKALREIFERWEAKLQEEGAGPQ